jgi:hypothetical protein
MSDAPDNRSPAVYEIKIKGHLDERWANWFEGMTFTLENDGTTTLTGPITDQAALHGLLNRIRDLGLPLLSVHGVDPTTKKE